MRRALLMLAPLVACAAPQPAPSEQPPFLAGAVTGTLRTDRVLEASGLVASARNEGVLWTHNDSGGEPALFALDATGRLVATLRVSGAANRDWEDIARRGDTLFVADIGDNGARRPEIMVYAVPEPARVQDTVVTALAAQRLRYPDGPRDAEALLVDPLTGDWFVVTKREAKVQVYRLAASARADSVVTLERVPGALPFRLVTAGDISPAGDELLLKTYAAVYYWKRGAGESLAETLMRPPTPLPYRAEPQGEAIAFTAPADAYVTLTEAQGRGGPQPLLRYRRPP